MAKKEKCRNYPSDCKSYGKIDPEGLCRRCANRQVRTILLEAVKQDVHKMHTETGITVWVETWHAAGASFDIIAKAFLGGITSQDIRRIEQGVMPVRNRKRELLGLPAMKRVPANLETFDPATHAVVPLDARPINGSVPKVSKPRPRRIAITVQDMNSARNSITHNIAVYRIRELHTLLAEYLEWADPENEPTRPAYAFDALDVERVMMERR